MQEVSSPTQVGMPGMYRWDNATSQPQPSTSIDPFFSSSPSLGYI